MHTKRRENGAAIASLTATRLNLRGFERVVTKVDLDNYERVGARPCELKVAVVLSLSDLEQAAEVTCHLDLSSFEHLLWHLALPPCHHGHCKTRSHWSVLSGLHQMRLIALIPVTPRYCKFCTSVETWIKKNRNTHVNTRRERCVSEITSGACCDFRCTFRRLRRCSQTCCIPSFSSLVRVNISLCCSKETLGCLSTKW